MTTIISDGSENSLKTPRFLEGNYLVRRANKSVLNTSLNLVPIGFHSKLNRDIFVTVTCCSKSWEVLPPEPAFWGWREVVGIAKEEFTNVCDGKYLLKKPQLCDEISPLLYFWKHNFIIHIKSL